jgi:hypothetical protein
MIALTRNDLVVLLATLSVGSCSFAKFDELEDSAPVKRIEQSGSIDSTFFGQLFLGLDNARQESGGRLIGAGTGENPALNTFTFADDGSLVSEQSSVEDYAERMELEGLIPRSLARAPYAEDLADASGRALAGPFAYLGANDGNTGRVAVIDVNEFIAAGSVTPDTQDAEVLPKEFGAAVSGARFSSAVEAGRDLLVGGRGRVWLLRFSTWPSEKSVERSLADLGANWPSQNDDDSLFSSVSAGDIDGDAGDEAVFAAPEADYLAVLTRAADCLAAAEDCEANLQQVELPDGVSAPASFGAAVLLADVRGDEALELVVGAPEAPNGGAVYVYDWNALSGDGQPAEVIEAPTGAQGFGRALAIGRLDGKDTRLLAISAPASAVDADGSSVANAGRIYLYRPGELERLPQPIQLKEPAEGDQIGLKLSVLPFKAEEATADLLLSSAPGAVLVFFAGTTEQHEDARR